VGAIDVAKKLSTCAGLTFLMNHEFLNTIFAFSSFFFWRAPLGFVLLGVISVKLFGSPEKFSFAFLLCSAFQPISWFVWLAFLFCLKNTSKSNQTTVLIDSLSLEIVAKRRGSDCRKRLQLGRNLSRRD